MADDKEIDALSGTETSGHEWDGIKELNTPLPRWWLWTFYLTIIWGIGYTIAYPAWPLINGATAGVLGYSTRAEVQADIDAVAEQNAALVSELSAADLASVDIGSEVHSFAVAGGAAVFRANCSQCHGAGAAGVQSAGYPNLLDDDWLWGGTRDQIAYTVTHGIRNEQSPDARFSQMPAFGDILEQDEILSAAEYVLKLSGQDHDAALAAAGEELFLEQCSACHGEQGMGDREQGAPNLTDAIWLYGGDRDTIVETITNARYGVMPAWGERLTEAEIKAVSLFVHQLGGGE